MGKRFVNSIFSIVTAAVTPVLFSVLSRLQDEKEQFNTTFLNVQKCVCMLLLPMGIGIFFYRDIVTDILFGSNWAEAADIIGIMAVTIAVRTIFVRLYSDVYRAKGRFFLPLVLQIVDLIILIPTCMISVNHGFWSLVYARAAIQLDLIIPELIIVFIVCGITPWKTLKNISHSLIACVAMSAVILIIRDVNDTLWWSFVSVFCCILIYFGVLLLFKEERNALFKFFKKQ